VGVRCPGCGREYADARFALGRTLECRCGRQVGPAAPVRWPRPEVEPGFCADAMLGRLARWLRVLGYDTWYEPDVEDAALVERALGGDRWLLTRDRGLPERFRIERVLVLEPDSPLEQLRLVAGRFGLRVGDRLFARCTRCNEPVEEVAAEAVADRLPPRVPRPGQRFTRCPSCGRVYWEGSHTRRMRATLLGVLPPLA
jgi:hypothetical protein